MMTGMGRDGVEGCKAILAAGGFTLGQDEATSVVYGMNKAAFLEGAVKAQFALDELPGILQNIAAFRAALEPSPHPERNHQRPCPRTQMTIPSKPSRYSPSTTVWKVPW